MAEKGGPSDDQNRILVYVEECESGRPPVVDSSNPSSSGGLILASHHYHQVQYDYQQPPQIQNRIHNPIGQKLTKVQFPQTHYQNQGVSTPFQQTKTHLPAQPQIHHLQQIPIQTHHQLTSQKTQAQPGTRFIEQQLQPAARKIYGRAASYDGPLPQLNLAKCEQAAAESTCSGEVQPLSPNQHQWQDQHSACVTPPQGWKRIIVNGLVIYITPSNTALSSPQQVKAYLLADDTCKCGLECPLNCESTFNFNPKVLTRPWCSPVIGPSDLNVLCNHKRKLINHENFDSADNINDTVDGLGRKKTTFVPDLPQNPLLKNDEKSQINNTPWRINKQDNVSEEHYSQLKYESSKSPLLTDSEDRFVISQGPPSNQDQVKCDYGSGNVDTFHKPQEPDLPSEPTSKPSLVVHSLSPSLYINKTPPWVQNKNNQNVATDRVSPLHPQVVSSSVWSNDIKKKQIKFVQKKRSSDESINCTTPLEPPSFLDDPSGYLAQQTALLNSTISRQNAPSASTLLPSNFNKYAPRPRFITNKSVAGNLLESSLERPKYEEPTSTFPDKIFDERDPIQGTTVSTSHKTHPDVRIPENIVTTMASSHTQSSNTITSVLAGKANTSTVSINNQPALKNQAVDEVQGNFQETENEEVLVPSSSQMVARSTYSKPVINQPSVLLPGPVLLQPSNLVVDGLNTTVQIPQILGNVVHNQAVDDTSLLSPDSKRKANLKKRKLSPVGSMLLSPQGSSNVMVQQQPVNAAPLMQAVTILPSKAGFAGTQQLITTNMLQPLSIVQNFPIQQFIVPTGVGSMVMSDGTILQDTVQLNVLTPVQNTNVFSNNGQNLLAPGMVIRTPTSQSAGKLIQNHQFLGSPNQYVVNNTFTGPVSPLLSVSPGQVHRSQDFLSPNVVVQQPCSSNTTVVQQNTTIVQQTTMVSSQQNQPSQTLNLNQNFILNDKPNIILTSEKQSFLLSPTSGDKIIISSENVCDNFVLSNAVKKNFVINNTEKQNITVNNCEKDYLSEKRNSVSTQTQVGSPIMSRENCPDTTTLSPVDHEVSTSVQETSSSESLPMVHCVSSSSQIDDQPFSEENYLGKLGNTHFTDSSMIHVKKPQSKNDSFYHKTHFSEVPDKTGMPDDETVSSS